MLAVLRRRLTYANVVSTVCLFIVLGGTSWALATGEIDSREIRNDTIRSKDVKDNTLRTRDVRNNEIRSRDIRNRTIVGRDVLSNTLKGSHVDEDSLEQVPSAALAADAAKLGGLTPAQLVRGPGSVFARSVSVPNATAETLLDLPGVGTLSVPAGATGCDANMTAATLGLSWRNSSGAEQELFHSRTDFADAQSRPHLERQTIAPAAVETVQTAGQIAAQRVDRTHVELKIAPTGAATPVTSIDLFAEFVDATPDSCRISASALVAG